MDENYGGGGLLTGGGGCLRGVIQARKLHRDPVVAVDHLKCNLTESVSDACLHIESNVHISEKMGTERSVLPLSLSFHLGPS